jgi:hypothetical protein
MDNHQSSYDHLIRIAIDGVRQLQEKTPEEMKRWVSQQPFFPSNVPVKGGEFVFITSDGYSALKKLGEAWHANDATRLKLLSRTAAEELSIHAFGDLLGSVNDLPGDLDAKSKLLRIMDERLQARTQPEHFYFPARVFEEPDVGTFAIGPVTFYRRVDWLDEVERLEGASYSWKSDVLHRWAHPQSRLRQLLTSLCDWLAGLIFRRWPGSWLARELVRLRMHRSYVDDIAKAVGACEWILAVAIEGRERSRSVECASVAALVALDSLGLSMPLKTARNLRGPFHERGRQLLYDLRQNVGQPLSFSISVDLPRLGGPPGAQATLLSDTIVLRRAVGCALMAFVSVTSTGNAPLLLQRWVEAMYWFGQARRERNEFIALVKYGIALDVLAKGTKARGILGLARAIFGKLDDDVIASDNRTLKQIVETVYNDGRSKIAHGGTLALLRELPIELSLADNFTAHVLAGYVVYATRYKGADTYEEFLAAVPEIRAATPQPSNSPAIEAKSTMKKPNHN